MYFVILQGGRGAAMAPSGAPGAPARALWVPAGLLLRLLATATAATTIILLLLIVFTSN